jgi:quinohemoprotein ethanol dehydrogenase
MRRRTTVALLLVLAVVVLVGAAVSQAGRTGSTGSVAVAPAWTAAQLNAYPGDNWIQPNGDLKNTRYSTLTQINASNVGTLKEAWKISLGICPAKDVSCGSNEANAVVQDGVYYIPSGKGHVFALDAATGKEIWRYTPVFETGYNVGTGGRNSGVAIAEGKVFEGRRDGYLVALDQQTGQELWKTEVIPWRKGGRLVAAPIYVDGILLVGTSGGDSYVRNDMQAFDATTGTQVWHWNIVPSPGQPGANTWAPGEYHYGGGAMWNSGAVDTKNGLVIIGTGNPVPWNSRGPGSNLWTDSLVGLDLHTGEFKWGFQTVHHDIWDADLPMSPVLIDAPYSVTSTKKVKVRVKVAYKVKGKTKYKFVTRTKSVKQTFKSNEAISMTAKYGWTFFLDRKTGKPLIPTPEVKVPVSTEPDVNSWPTQPIPQSDNVLNFPKKPGGGGVLCAKPAATWEGAAPNGTPFKLGCHFDPYTTKEFVVTPFENVEWGPNAYNPTLKSLVSCAVDTRQRAWSQVPKASQTLVPGVSGTGVLGRTSPTQTHTGTLTALDLKGKRIWQQVWDAPCISGSTNTASNLTFVGTTGGASGRGSLLAIDTATGKTLWESPKMDAMATAPPMTYTVAGKQYVSVLVGGQNRDDPTGGVCNPKPCGRGDYIYTYALP